MDTCQLRNVLSTSKAFGDFWASGSRAPQTFTQKALNCGFQVSGFGNLGLGFPQTSNPEILGFRVSGSEFRVSGSGFRVPSFGFRVSCFGFRVPCSAFRVSGSEFLVSGLGIRISGFWFRVSDLGFRVQGSPIVGSVIGELGVKVRIGSVLISAKRVFIDRMTSNRTLRCPQRARSKGLADTSSKIM